jgi:hypothetical protein
VNKEDAEDTEREKEERRDERRYSGMGHTVGAMHASPARPASDTLHLRRGVLRTPFAANERHNTMDAQTANLFPNTAASGDEDTRDSAITAEREMPCPVCGHPMPDLKGGKDTICPVCGFKDSCCY